MAHRFLSLLIALFAAACYVSGPDGGPNPGTVTVSFHKDVEPILQQHCQNCHVTGGIAPFPLMTYAQAQPYAQDIAAQTGARKMPPWGARNTSECTTRSGWKEDPSLTDDQIKTLADWAAQGAAEGNPADAPPPYTPPPNGLAGVQADLAPPSGFVLPPGETHDEFQCFVLDPQISATTYINGTAVLPGNSLIVHHAVVYTDPNRESLALVTNPQQNSYPCFGGPHVSNASLVTAWAPGGMPHEFASNIGMPIQPSSLLVMQIHYHPHTVDARNQDPDATHLQLRYTTGTPQYFAVSAIVGNLATAQAGLQPGPDDPGYPVFDIPANVSGHTETMEVTVPAGLTNGRPAWIYSVGGHMHLVGNDLKVTLDRKIPTSSNPAQECLMQIPRWDFYWQRQYDYAIDDVTALPSIASGDKLTVRCTYDNTQGNTALTSELTEQGKQQPVDVKLGESTLDEMCLALLTAVVPAP